MSHDSSRDILCVLPAIIFLPLSKIKCSIRSLSPQINRIQSFEFFPASCSSGFVEDREILWWLSLFHSLAHAPNSFCCSSQLLQCVLNLATALKVHFLMKIKLIKSYSVTHFFFFFLGNPPCVAQHPVMLLMAEEFFGDFFGTFRISVVHNSYCLPVGMNSL